MTFPHALKCIAEGIHKALTPGWIQIDKVFSGLFGILEVFETTVNATKYKKMVRGK